MLMLGRQGIHAFPQKVDYLLDKYSLFSLKGCYVWGWSEPLFRDLGYEIVESLDNSAYEGATRIHNMNREIPAPVARYDYIYDGGTIEHIFNCPGMEFINSVRNSFYRRSILNMVWRLWKCILDL
uniref:Methyltransferase n=1 Tax=viral metagenome TaxID=1070528 RepID=A0A6C0K7R4_9ZZZZ